MVQDMLVCEQTQGQSVYEHGISVKAHTFQILDYLRGGDTLEGWRIPKWLEDYKSSLLHSLWDDEVISLYTLYHDCGKPYCRFVDADGKVHFPDHANVSAEVFAGMKDELDGNSHWVSKLIGWDMVLHTETQEQIKERLREEMDEEDVFTLLIVGLAELHSNAKLFGGIESTSFKMKWKKLDKRGKWLCKEYLTRDDEVTIKRKDIKYLWHCGYWDGPLSGMCLHDGEKCWFDMVKEYNNGSRTFKVVRLTPEQLKEEEYWHDLFEEKVSTASSYDENERRHLSADHSHLRPYELHHEFYDEQKKNRKDRDFSKNEVIGYFNDYI
jgi:hypothetical protein